MIITLFAKILFWAWGFAPGEKAIVLCIVLAFMETLLEIFGYFMWKDIHR